MRTPLGMETQTCPVDPSRADAAQGRTRSRRSSPQSPTSFDRLGPLGALLAVPKGVEMAESTNTVCPRCGNSFGDGDRTTVAGSGVATIAEEGSTVVNGGGSRTLEMQPYLIHV